MWFKGTIGESTGSTDVRTCETGYMSQGVCATGLKRMNTTVIDTMIKASQCVYQDASGAVVTERQDSVCGLSATPSSYCKIGAEDDEFKTILNLVRYRILNCSYLQAKSYTQMDLPACHID